MKIHCLYDQLIPIRELKKLFHPKNRNKHPQEQIERLAKILEYQGIRYPVKISKMSGYITSGHGRVLAAELNGWAEFPVNLQDYTDPAQEYADLQADNAIALWAELDRELIQIDIQDFPDLDLDLLALKPLQIEEDIDLKTEDDNNYSRKIEAPIYKPKGEKPQIKELYDLSKTISLVKEIQSSELDEDLKEFLKFAAYRHTVFNYQKIAEFYCHADEKIQNLMENSALVIIDFDKAIQNGFVQMTQELLEAYDQEY